MKIQSHYTVSKLRCGVEQQTVLNLLGWVTLKTQRMKATAKRI